MKKGKIHLFVLKRYVPQTTLEAPLERLNNALLNHFDEDTRAFRKEHIG